MVLSADQLTSLGSVLVVVLLLWMWLPGALLLAGGCSIFAVALTRQSSQNQGELSAKNGEEPVGKVTRTQYTYQSPQGDDQGINKVTTTTTSLGRRASGPKITEIEDVHETSERKSSIKSKDVEEVTGRRSVERVPNRKSSPQKSSSEDDEQRRNERFSSQEEDEEVQKISRVSSTSQRYTSSTDSAKRTSSTPTRQTKTSSPSLRRQRSSEDDSAEDKRKTVVRGDSVRALQHKFQQATENAANSAPLRSQAPRAGLILRTSSFTTADQQESVSSTLKQSTALSADKRSGRQSPEKRKESLSDATTVSRHSPTSDTKRDSVTETTRRESLKTSGDSTVTRVTETTTTSFLDNTSRVTGVQDVLTRMRNADLVSESGDTDADREARALLNKFLGASVILQGMEQGMRAGTVPDGTPGSAALVSSVEKQRVVTVGYGVSVSIFSSLLILEKIRFTALKLVPLHEKMRCNSTSSGNQEDGENILDFSSNLSPTVLGTNSINGPPPIEIHVEELGHYISKSCLLGRRGGQL
ncbi:hypothetical protein J6590_043264 [Homalodisca vitripennis]|nr:hypothetical protein J6590_043264 [Homalodisca vitripennis]